MSELLITGGGGFAGSHLVRAASEMGFPVTAVNRSFAEKIDGVNYFNCDLTQIADLDRIFNTGSPEVIFHLGNKTTGRYGDPGTTFSNNVNTTAALIKVCAKNRFSGRIIYASSTSVYGTAGPGGFFSEESPTNPANSYGKSKHLQEQMLLEARERLGFNLVIARATNHSGPGQIGEFLLPRLAGQITDIKNGISSAIEVWNSASKVDFVDVRDVAAAYLLLAEKGVDGETYNVSRGIPMTIEEIARIISTETLGYAVPVTSIKPEDLRSAEYNNTKISNLGWSARISGFDSIRDFLHWHFSHNSK